MLSVRLISKETIKPSSPTPQNLHSFPLSLLDQVMPPFYVSLLLFYSGSDITKYDPVEKANRLRDSLSKTLTIFYPLAGRLRKPMGSGCSTHIDCNGDEGAEFSVTRVDGDLDKVLMHPPIEELSRLLPDKSSRVVYGDPLLTVQLNVFDCGGSVLGICFAHQVADMTSTAMLLNSWADIARGGDGQPHPTFNLASLFPSNSVEGLEPMLLDPKEPCAILKRFIIKPSHMEKLRGGDSYDNREQHPTRIEAVSTLVWRCVMRAREKETPNMGRMLAYHTVNLRKRMADQEAASSFGNSLSGVAVLTEEVGVKDTWDSRRSQGILEKGLRDKLSMVNGSDYAVDLVKKSMLAMHKVRRREDGEDALLVSSWCRFPFYKTDFGWGEPVWLSCSGKSGTNMVWQIDTKEEGGMEIWVSLVEEEMKWFEKDPELLEFACAG